MEMVAIGLPLRLAPPVSGRRVVPLHAQMIPWQEIAALKQLV